jgi:hypothetical protein
MSYTDPPCSLFSEPTLFVSRPQNLKVLRGSDVTFECGVKADASTPVTTTWMKNKRPLSLNWRCASYQTYELRGAGSRME